MAFSHEERKIKFGVAWNGVVGRDAGNSKDDY